MAARSSGFTVAENEMMSSLPQNTLDAPMATTGPFGQFVSVTRRLAFFQRMVPSATAAAGSVGQSGSL